VLREGEEERELRGKCSARVRRGAVLRLETPGGGGWGEAAEGFEELTAATAAKV
jgi:N-methylhydantoinase B/oxoprolinase/acetone carboxylase alpha subunit